MSERNLRKTRVGTVVSDKMDKTVVVAIQDNVRHPLYKKIIKRTVKFKAHDEQNACGVGDKVEIIMDRFGDAAEMYEHDDETAKAIVKIRKSEPFFGWIAGLGGTVRIHGPKSLKDEYNKYLKGLIEE